MGQYQRMDYGFVFSPTNEEIFKGYLKPLIDGHKDAYLSIIYNTDELYGEKVDIERTFEKGLKNHMQYMERLDDDSVWFFTKLKRLGRTRFQRKAGVGTWTGIDTGKVAYEDKKESLKGNIRSFGFTVKEDGLVLHDVKPPKRKRPSESIRDDVNNSANWIMHEFSIEKDGKQYSDYVIVKIKRKTNDTASCSHQAQNNVAVEVEEVQNKALVEVEDVHATISPPVAYQYQLPPSGYQHDETAAPPPLQDTQQGEYNWDLSTDSLMAQLGQGSIDHVRLEDLYLLTDSLMVDQEENIYVPVADGDFRAIEGGNAAAQDYYQQSTNATFVTNSEAEAVQPQKENSDDEFALDLEFLLSEDEEVQPQKDISGNQFF